MYTYLCILPNNFLFAPTRQSGRYSSVWHQQSLFSFFFSFFPVLNVTTTVGTTRVGFWTWIRSSRHWTGAGNGLLVSMLENSTYLFDRSHNTGAIDVKMDGFVLEGKRSFKMLEFSFSSKLDWGSYIISC